MKQTLSKFNLIFVPIFILFTVFSVFAQPTEEQRRLEAKSAYDEGGKLLRERTYKSYRLALEQYELSAKIYKELSHPSDKANFASSLLGVGRMKELLDDNDSALQVYFKALPIFREFELKDLEARTLNNIGLLYSKFGEKQKALEYLLLSLPLRTDDYGKANTLDSIGSVYANTGEAGKAIEYFNRALAIQVFSDDEFAKAGQAVSLNGLGLVYNSLGSNKEALEYFDRLLVLRRNQGNKDGEATALHNIGLATAALGNKTKAIEFFEKSLEILSELGFENKKATVFSQIGVVYLELKQQQKSIEYSKRAIPLYQAMNDKIGEAIALNSIALAFAEIGENSSALENLSKALVIVKNSGSKPFEAVMLGNLMLVSKNLKRNQAGIIFGKQSVNIYQKLRGEITDLLKSTQNTYLKSIEQTYRNLADLLIESGRFEEAKAVLQMLKEQEFSEFVKRDASEIKTLNQRVTLNEAEKELIKRYTELSDKIAEIGVEFQKLDDKKQRLSIANENLSAEEQTKYTQLSDRLSVANAAFQLFVEKDLGKQLGTAAIKNIEIDRDLQAKLRLRGNGTIALYTVVTENRYRVILTTPNLQIDAKTDIKAVDLNKKIFDFRDALLNKKIDPRPLGKEIYDILLKPIEKELKASNAKTLVWSLDGVLRYIPLAALSPDGKTYLIEQYQNVLLTSKTRDDLPNSDKSPQALGMGISEEQKISYPESPNEEVVLSAIPGTKTELLTIIQDENNPLEKGIFKGKRFLDGEFSLANLQDSLAARTSDGQKKFSIVHFASHFRLGNNWSESFLLLGNAKLLTLQNIVNSPALNFENVELVTLSACKTGVNADSSGKEVESLAGAIQTKGGRTVIATLWDVVDASTSVLMSNFYRLKKENPKLTKAEALQKAQIEMIRGTAANTKPRFVHPYYWSPFVMLGNWR
jgi:CHAT domain-containing protein